jgi:chemotaxis receptor (MCP) glutamine deamidase CheD
MVLIIEVIMVATTPILTTDKFATIMVVGNGTRMSITISDPGNYIYTLHHALFVPYTSLHAILAVVHNSLHEKEI